MIESLAAASDTELRAAVVELAAQLARLRYRQLAVLAELNARAVPGTLGLRGLPELITADLRCSRATARATARAVERFGARRSLTGEQLAPRYPATADAYAQGAISGEHAGVIGDVIEAIPSPTRAEHAAAVEATLLEHAPSTDPHTLKQLGQRILTHLDPDGPAPAEQRAQRSHRRVGLLRNPDSSGSLDGLLTPACQAIWEAVLTPLAAARPADALGEDARTPGQRWHDAFEEAGRRLLESGTLPDQAGLASQLIITISLTDLERRAGAATTHHGGILTVTEALRLASNGGLLPAILDDTGGILGYGRARRLASPGQRKALFARDRGCSFPGCPRAAALSEIHHTTDWARGGHTNLDTLTIACGYHNNEAPRQGWTTIMINGIPHWKPPRWKDPDQQPLRNYLHHPELLRPRRT